MSSINVPMYSSIKHDHICVQIQVVVVVVAMMMVVMMMVIVVVDSVKEVLLVFLLEPLQDFSSCCNSVRNL